VLPSLDQLLSKLKILFTFLTKRGTLMRRSTVLSLPSQLEFRGWSKRALVPDLQESWFQPEIFHKKTGMKIMFLYWRQNIQHIDTQHNYTQHNDTRHNDIQNLEKRLSCSQSTKLAPFIDTP